LNSTLTNAGQPEICPTFNQNTKTLPMENIDYNTDLPLDQELYTIEWSDIENTEIDYENYLNDIENFFREDFEHDILE
jgi:hypothetical protein